jgi:hypothetical protein
MAFPEAVCFEEMLCESLDEKFGANLGYSDLRLMYTSDYGGKPSPNFRLVLTPLNIRTGSRNWPALLQHSIIVPVPRFPVAVNPFFIIAESGFLYICMPL